MSVVFMQAARTTKEGLWVQVDLGKQRMLVTVYLK